MPPNSRPNPYKGPDHFRTGDKAPFCGRDLEVSQLTNLLIAERIVLLHSLSGAGKTSLVLAGLVPVMQQKAFHIHRVIRTAPSPEVVANTGEAFTAEKDFNWYTFSALLALEEAYPAEKRLDHASLAHLTLDDYLTYRAQGEAQARAELLFFDQFEEILTINPLDVDHKKLFFAQLGEALSAPNRWALFAMRSDYIGALGPYEHLVPTFFTNTYLLNSLSLEGARQAIRQPATAHGVNFTEEAAQILVDELSQTRVQGSDGNFEDCQGTTVEPVQLQVICFRLWENLDSADTIIDAQDVKKCGDVNESLAEYYAKTIARAATFSEERAIRKWIEKRLITKDGIRLQVLLGTEVSEEKLDPRVVPLLEDSHILRSESRAAKRWVELAHDSLVQPVRANNEAWFKAELAPWQQQAEVWNNQGRSPDYLVVGPALAEAQAWKEKHPAVVITETEKHFLEAAVSRQKEIDNDRQQNARIRQLAIGASVVSILALLALVFAIISYNRAIEQEKLTSARELAAKALLTLEFDPHTSLGLALEAVSAAETEEALDSLRKSVVADRQLILVRQPSYVLSASYSQDGKKVLTVCGDGFARLGDAATGEVLATLGDSQAKAKTATFSPDGKIVLTAHEDGSIRLWDIEHCTPECTVRVLKGHRAQILSAIFSPDGKRIASASDDLTALVWDIATGQQLFRLGDGQEMNRVAYSPDGGWLVAFRDEKGPAYICDPATGRILREVGNPGNGISTIAFDRNGQYLAAATTIGFNLEVWELATGKRLAELPGHTGEVMNLLFNQNGDLLLSASRDQTARLWGWRESRLITEYRDHTSEINNAVFSRDERLLLTASSDHTARIWEAFSGSSLAVLRGHTHWVYGATFNPAGDQILTSSADGTLRTWRVDRQAFVIDLRGHHQGVTRAAFSPDGKLVVTASIDHTARIWDAETGATRTVLVGHTAQLTRAVFSPDGNFVATASKDETARIWDLRQCAPVCSFIELRGHTLGLKSIGFSPDGRRLVTASEDNSARIWNRETGQEVMVLPHGDWVNDAAFSPDGKYVVTASAAADPVATVWEAETGKMVVQLDGHTSDLTSASFSPDGRLVLTTSRDKTARVWEWEKCQAGGECLSAELRLEDWVLDGAFSPDGAWVAISGKDGAVEVWNLEPLVRISRLPRHTGEVSGIAFSPNLHQMVSASSDSQAHIWPRAYFAPISEVLKLACERIGMEAAPAYPACAGP